MGSGKVMKTGFKKILFPTDFSPSAELAVPLALRMAAAFDAQITCLHVTEDPIEEWICSWSLAPDAADPTGGGGRAGHRSTALQQLKAFAGEHFGTLASPPRLAVVEGRPAEAIVRYAEENGFDLIVMGGKAYGDAEPRLHETSTDRVLRSSSTPVLTACEPAAQFIRL